MNGRVMTRSCGECSPGRRRPSGVEAQRFRPGWRQAFSLRVGSVP